MRRPHSETTTSAGINNVLSVDPAYEHQVHSSRFTCHITALTILRSYGLDRFLGGPLRRHQVRPAEWAERRRRYAPRHHRRKDRLVCHARQGHLVQLHSRHGFERRPLGFHWREPAPKGVHGQPERERRERLAHWYRLFVIPHHQTSDWYMG